MPGCTGWPAMAASPRGWRRCSAGCVTSCRGAAARGRRVAAYGAAAKGCTLLNTSRVGAADIAFVADRAPSKQGRLLPGCRVPIVAPEVLLASPPDDLLILPWNIAGEIAGELAALRRAGTRFWVAVPALRAL